MKTSQKIDRALVFIGMQGSGKGTQVKVLSEMFDIPSIDAGGLLRWHLDNNTEYAPLIAPILQGHYVRDDIVDKVVGDKILSLGRGNGFLLDGYPRSTVQAQNLLNLVDQAFVFNLVIPEEEALRRLLARVACKACGCTYSSFSGQPCPVCGCVETIVRTDDNEEAIRNRLAHNAEKSGATLALLASKFTVHSIDADLPVEQVTNSILSILGKGN